MESQVTEVAEKAVAATAQIAAGTVNVPSETLTGMVMETVHLMGYSFIAGSLFTVLLIMVLDLLKLARESREAKA